MRMILDIIRPDNGHITWNGQDMREVPRHSLGYLPEERGLYPKMKVDEQLLFLARLNGLSKQDATRELDEWLERFQINANRKKNSPREISRKCSFSPPFCTIPRFSSWMSHSVVSIPSMLTC